MNHPPSLTRNRKWHRAINRMATQHCLCVKGFVPTEKYYFNWSSCQSTAMFDHWLRSWLKECVNKTNAFYRNTIVLEYNTNLLLRTKNYCKWENDGQIMLLIRFHLMFEFGIWNNLPHFKGFGFLNSCDLANTVAI